MSKGKIYLLISALSYGIAPTLSVEAEGEGVNGITMTFLRSVLCLPVLLAVLGINRAPMKLTRREIRHILLLGVFGCALPILALHLSYGYISTGLATTLHFIYPLVIVLASAVLYGEKISTIKMAAVVSVTLGLFMFADISELSSKAGIVLALISGIFYSFYVLYMEKSGLKNMNYLKLTFYVMLTASISVLIFGITTDTIKFAPITSAGWMYSILVSIMITLISVPLFQLGVRYEGAQTAGILSTVEPLTGIAVGRIFLKETITPVQYIGIALILMGLVIIEIKGLPIKKHHCHNE